MSLRYGASSSDRLTMSAAASINDLAEWTNIGWYRPVGFGGGGLRMWSKQSTSAQRHAGAIANSSGALTTDAQRATTDDTCTTSDLMLLDVWQVVAFTRSATDGVRVFMGSSERAMSECVYASRTVGSGALEADNANPMYFGNRDTFASAFIGQIQEQAHFARVLSLDDMRQWSANPMPWDARVFVIHGQNGTGTQTDLTGNGNHGTVTGATLSFDRAYEMDFDHYQRPRWWGNVAAGASVKIRYYYDMITGAA